MLFLDSVAEVCILHLNVGVYIFFHRLYAMFPNNFLSYLQSLYNGEKTSRKELIFQQIIKVFCPWSDLFCVGLRTWVFDIKQEYLYIWEISGLSFI